MGIWNCQTKARSAKKFTEHFGWQDLDLKAAHSQNSANIELLECAFFWSFESIDNISETKRATDDTGDTGDKEDAGDQADHTC